MVAFCVLAVIGGMTFLPFVAGISAMTGKPQSLAGFFASVGALYLKWSPPRAVWQFKD